MSQPATPPTRTAEPVPVQIDSAPPRRSKVTGGLAALACAACCALPLLIAAGVLTGAGAAILEQILLAVAAGLAVLALGMWWLHRRRSAQRAGGAGCGCAGSGCGC
jgi:high-affinity Fe2+/Pb2+ permease